MSRCLKMLGMVIFLSLLVVPGFSQMRGTGVYIGAAFYHSPEENINSGIGSSLGLIVPLNPRVSLAAEWKYVQYSVGKQEDGFLKGSLSVTPLLVALRYKLIENSLVAPYVFGGAGWFFARFNPEARLDEDEAQVLKQGPKSGLGFYGGVGILYQASPAVALYGEGLYLYRQTDVQTTYLSGSTEMFPVNLSAFSAVLGIRFIF